ncbi:MAG: carbon-nitrogen hydrolase family protein, partial [Balneolaceae bacterium]
ESIAMVKTAVREAVSRGAEFLALPENFAFMGDEIEKHRQAEVIEEAVLKAIPELAKEYGITIMAGGYPVRAKSGKVYNRAIIVNSDGEIKGSYNKIHLFDVELSDDETYRESETVEAGEPEPVVSEIHINGGNVQTGLSICYDIRFPELYRRLADLGAEIVCIPAAFTRPTGEAHWETLLRARAIENSCYVIAPAQTGVHGEKRKTHGHSMIIDPWGRILADAGTEPGMAIAAIDTAFIRDVRRKLPSLRHRVLR